VVNPVDHWNQLDPQILIFRMKAGKGRSLAHDLVEIRRMLEVEAAGLAAVRATEDDIATLRELLANMVAAVPDMTRHSPLENQFHTRIWHAGGNALLLHLLKTLGEVFGAAKEFVYGSNLPDWDTYHITLLEAIERHDVNGARQAMDCDIARFEEELRIAIEKGPKPATAIGPTRLWETGWNSYPLE
jgi:DNA-binding FadR family transcriptional regulator